jgi:hypothetical protein
MRIMRTIGAVCASATLLALAACGHSGGSSSAENKAKAVASASANVAAENVVKNQVTACVNRTPTTKLLRSSGRQQLINCLEQLVPPAKQDKFKQCVANAAVTNKVWTKAGRSTFENLSVAKCITQVTGTATPVAPSATTSNK